MSLVGFHFRQREFLLSKIIFLSFFSTIRTSLCIVTAKIPVSYDDIYSPRLA